MYSAGSSSPGRAPVWRCCGCVAWGAPSRADLLLPGDEPPLGGLQPVGRPAGWAVARGPDRLVGHPRQAGLEALAVRRGGAVPIGDQRRAGAAVPVVPRPAEIADVVRVGP